MARKASLSVSDIAVELRRLGFNVSPMGSKSQPARLGDLDLYLKKAIREDEVLVIGPWFASKLGDLLAVPGVRRSSTATEFAHSTSYTAFPKRIHKGRTPTNYGLDFAVETAEALRVFVGLLLGQTVEDVSSASIAEEVDVDAETDTQANGDGGIDPRTESEVMSLARIGQGRFRDDLERRWGVRCAVTGLEGRALLRASHIQPWCDSSDRERLDPDNGLLLAVHIDVLFDNGLISFADDGAMLLSTTLSATTRQILGIDRALSIEGLSEGNRRYLTSHRRVHFPQAGA